MPRARNIDSIRVLEISRRRKFQKNQNFRFWSKSLKNTKNMIFQILRFWKFFRSDPKFGIFKDLARTNDDANNLKTKLSRKLLLEHFYITCSLVGSVFPRDSESLVFLATYFSPILDYPSKISKISKFGRKINISLYQNLTKIWDFLSKNIFCQTFRVARGCSWTLMDAHGRSWELLARLTNKNIFK